MADESADLIGKVIGGCRLERLIGGGAMGAVYQARHLALQKDVAVKILAERLAGDAQYVQRFQAEARLAAQIEHANAVQVLNVGSDGACHYIIMQYVAGESLGARLAREGRLPPREAVRIARGIADGLAAAHAKGIVHRDIKPANVLLTRDGEVKVADLGLAKALGGIGDSSSLTQAGQTMGTPQYMPPEQAEDARSADARSDIYALGCTLYHMLTGAPPFSAKTAMLVIKQHLSDTAPSPAALRPEVPPALSDLVVRMMAKRREDRPQSSTEVAAALDRIAGGTASGQQPADKRKLWLAVGAGSALLLVLLLAGLSPSPAQKAYETAKAGWEANPGDYAAALASFQKVAEQFPETRWAAKAEESARGVQRARDLAAATAFERIQMASQAAAQSRQYAAAVKVWEDFPPALLAGDYVGKVRAARLKARLPARIDTFVRACQTQQYETELQHLDPEEVATKGREPTLNMLKLLTGLLSLGIELEGWELKSAQFSDDLTRCNVMVGLKLLNKFNKQHTTNDAPQVWQLVKDEWFLQTRTPEAK